MSPTNPPEFDAKPFKQSRKTTLPKIAAPLWVLDSLPLSKSLNRQINANIGKAYAKLPVFTAISIHCKNRTTDTKTHDTPTSVRQRISICATRSTRLQTMLRFIGAWILCFFVSLRYNRFVKYTDFTLINR